MIRQGAHIPSVVGVMHLTSGNRHGPSGYPV